MEVVHKYFPPFNDSCLEKILVAAAESYLEDMDMGEDMPINAGELHTYRLAHCIQVN
jgi:hypothetical protein